MKYSIPSDVAALDRDRDGYVDRIYVGDTGGNIWRVDVGDASLANWTVNKLATVGYDAVNNNPSGASSSIRPMWCTARTQSVHTMPS